MTEEENLKGFAVSYLFTPVLLRAKKYVHNNILLHFLHSMQLQHIISYYYYYLVENSLQFIYFYLRIGIISVMVTPSHYTFYRP